MKVKLMVVLGTMIAITLVTASVWAASPTGGAESGEITVYVEPTGTVDKQQTIAIAPGMTTRCATFAIM